MLFDTRPGPIGDRIDRISAGKPKQRARAKGPSHVVSDRLEGRPAVGRRWGSAPTRWGGWGGGWPERGGERREKMGERGREENARRKEKEEGEGAGPIRSV